MARLADGDASSTRQPQLSRTAIHDNKLYFFKLFPVHVKLIEHRRSLDDLPQKRPLSSFNPSNADCEPLDLLSQPSMASLESPLTQQARPDVFEPKVVGLYRRLFRVR